VNVTATGSPILSYTKSRAFALPLERTINNFVSSAMAKGLDIEFEYDWLNRGRRSQHGGKDGMAVI
jgi:hypothetical protein